MSEQFGSFVLDFGQKMKTKRAKFASFLNANRKITFNERMNGRRKKANACASFNWPVSFEILRIKLVLENERFE